MRRLGLVLVVAAVDALGRQALVVGRRGVALQAAGVERVELEKLCTNAYDRQSILDFGNARPLDLGLRVGAFGLALQRVRGVWDDHEARGAHLRAELTALGPLAVKVGQTLSQREDILPGDVCEALKSLQTQNEPFEDAVAFRVIAEELGYFDGPIAPGAVPAGDFATQVAVHHALELLLLLRARVVVDDAAAAERVVHLQLELQRLDVALVLLQEQQRVHAEVHRRVVLHLSRGACFMPGQNQGEAERDREVQSGGEELDPGFRRGCRQSRSERSILRGGGPSAQSHASQAVYQRWDVS